ncbi:MAG: peptidylprolyl isomerase [Gammaproteobacteria bacterium]|nr:peptidylprolyl isomerase [Gammaproteobacteria bacterium]
MKHFPPSARTRLCAAALMVLSLAACAKSPTSASAPAADATQNAVAVVNGTAIPREVYDFYVKALTHGKDASTLTPEQRSQVLDQLVGMQLMVQQADKDGAAKDAEAQAQLQLDRMRVLADAEAQKIIKDHPPTDQEVKNEYDTIVAGMDKTEYHARHILVKSHDLALALTKRLKAGAKFAALAKANSIDDGSKMNGGDLGWFQASRMVKPFADAVKSLKKGQITPEPVQTQYGWHIIQLVDTRPLAPPPLTQVEQQVKNDLIQKRLQAYVEQLKKSATIKTNLN